MKARRPGVVLGVALTFLAGAVPLLATPAAAAGCTTPKGVYTQATPWAQKLLDAPRIWPLSTGTGVTVAVIGTGVDGANAQFAPGQVLPQVNLLADPGPMPDCDGRGTFAAGIVAAHANAATTFAGIAPGAHILPIRYIQSTSDTSQGADPNALANAVNQAVSAGGGVILIVVPAGVDSDQLRAAVHNAHNAGDVVVSPAIGNQAGASSYPTATPGVLGVGAVNASGSAVQTESGDYVALAAPGANLVSTSAGADGRLGNTWPVQDPSFAAAYVAGTVALLRSYQPSLTPDQITARLTLTASRPATGTHDAHLGWGVIDAYAAVSTALPADVAPPGTGPASARQVSIAPASASAPLGSPYRWAGVAALLGVSVAGLILFGAKTLRRGRNRGWRVGR